MQRVIGVLFVIVLASFALAACGGKTQTVTENDNGKTVTLNTGDKLVVKLDGNPTTGYTWQLNDFDTSTTRNGILAKISAPGFSNCCARLNGHSSTLAADSIHGQEASASAPSTSVFMYLQSGA